MRAPYSRTLFDLLCEMAQQDPGHEAVVSAGERLSYGALRERSLRVAAALSSLGLARGVPMGLLANNRAEWVAVCFGAAALGTPLVAFNTWVKSWDLEYLLEHSRVRALVTLASLGRQDYLASLRELVPELWQQPPGRWRSPRYPHLRDVIVIGEAESFPAGARSYEGWLAEAARRFEPPAPGAGPSATDTAFVLYTSGSTARPKAVPLLHYASVENGFNIGERQGFTSAERVLLSPPLFWSYGSANAMMATMTHRATLVLQPEHDPAEALRLIESERCTAIYTLPNITHALVSHPDFDPLRTRTLRTGLTIGSPEQVRQAALVLGAAELCNVYGSTETYGNCCVTPHDLPLDVRAACQGPPLPGVTVRAVHPETRRPVAEGEPGELEVHGYVTPGYADNPEENARAFTADGFFRSGDMGWLDERGFVHYFTRANEMIKTGGINVSPLEVEAFLATHPAVLHVAVVGAPDAVRGEAVWAYVVPRPGQAPSPEALIAHCRDHMAGYKAPAHIELCASLPLTDTGKLARKELKRRAAEQAAALAAQQAAQQTAPQGTSRTLARPARRSKAPSKGESR